MEQPLLFQTAGVYAGDMELVLSIELDYLRIRAARWRECVYVLQSVFLLLLFSVRHATVHKYETTVLGNG